MSTTTALKPLWKSGMQENLDASRIVLSYAYMYSKCNGVVTNKQKEEKVGGLEYGGGSPKSDS
jgi:hypothetical protein